MRNLFRLRIDEIARNLASWLPHEKNPGWMTGLAGQAVFFAEFERNYGADALLELTGISYRDVLAKCFKMIDQGFSNPTFASGLSGIAWVLHYLGLTNQLLDEEVTAIDELLPGLKKWSMEQVRVGNIDLLNGGLGVEWAMMHKPDFIFNDQISGEFISPESFLTSSSIDMGLAHGLPSRLLFAARAGSAIVEGKALLDQGVALMLSFADWDQSSGSVFTSRIHPGRKITSGDYEASRMAWCYGDPGIGAALVQIGKLSGKPKWCDQGEQLLEIAAKRRDPHSNMVWDACVCHGSAGLALIFHIYGKLLNNKKLKDASNYWILETLKPSSYLFKRAGDEYLPNYSFLEGITGVALTLMAVERDEIPAWHDGFLL